MMPTRVALFPYDEKLEKDDAFLDELMLVASALQTQVTRDVGPIWGISALVSAFSSVRRVPRGYAPFGITRNNLPLNRSGFHYSADGTPAALIQYCGDWSTSASHELIEMLCDPTGTETLTASSLGDKKLFAVGDRSEVVEGDDDYVDQGLVTYVKEVCDPVEDSIYEIDGVNVSDFITPDFYASKPGPSYTRYSFKGDVTEPLQLLQGGYITWASQAGPGGQPSLVYQATAPNGAASPVDAGQLKIMVLGQAPHVLSRAWLYANAESDPKRTDQASAACGEPKQYVDTSDEAREYAKGLRNQMDRARKASGTPQNLDTLLTLVRNLARNENFREQFRVDPPGALQSIGLRNVTAPVPPVELQPHETYQRLQGSLEQAHRVGYNFSETPLDASLQWGARLPGG